MYFLPFQMWKYLYLISMIVFVNASEKEVSDFDAKLQDLDEKLKAQLKVIDDQINHIDWYFDVGYNHKDKPIMDDVDEFVRKALTLHHNKNITSQIVLARSEYKY